LPSLTTRCPIEVRNKLMQLCFEWSEIQWILYAPPQACQYRGLRLCLHLLLYYHLQLCKALFPDRRKSKKQAVKISFDPVVTLLSNNPRNLCISDLKLVIERVCLQKQLQKEDLVKSAVPERRWSTLRKKEFIIIYEELQKQSRSETNQVEHTSITSPTQPPKDTIDSVMRLYGHVLMAHTAGFYEVMDFKNASAERGEGFFAHVKQIFKHLTARDLSNDQTLREVFVRYGMRAHHYQNYIRRDKSSTNSRIQKTFQGHVFHELMLIETVEEQVDMNALMTYLESWKYVEGLDWTIVRKENIRSITFNTLADTQEVFNKFSTVVK